MTCYADGAYYSLIGKKYTISAAFCQEVAKKQFPEVWLVDTEREGGGKATEPWVRRAPKGR